MQYYILVPHKEILLGVYNAGFYLTELSPKSKSQSKISSCLVSSLVTLSISFPDFHRQSLHLCHDIHIKNTELSEDR